MLKIYILGLLLITSLLSVGQSQGYKIKVKIMPLKNQPVYLGYHYGDNQYVVDTAMLNNNSEAIFSKPHTLPEGMYLIVLPDMRYFNIILSKNQNLSIENDTSNLYLNLKIENDDENKLFAEYQKQLYLNKLKNEEYKKRIKQYPDSAIIYNELINQNKNNLLQQKNEWIDKHPDWLFTKILKAILPTPFTFDASLFFANVDFSDQRLLFSPAYVQKLDDFFTSIPSLTINNIDSLHRAIDYILMQSMKNTSVYEEITKYLISQFDLSGNYPNPDAFFYIADRYFLNGLCPWVSDAFKAKLKKYNERIKTICIGSTFPSLYLSDIHNKKIKITDTKSNYTLVVFWNPECEHCIDYMKKIKNVYTSYNRNELEVVAILTGSNSELWKKEMDNYPWIHLYDPKHINDFIEELFLFNTPQVFLLDKNKKIIAKDILAEELKNWIK
ncbi:MAG: thioredoxin-like domain-containing protein [Bacteroidales bacterium]